MHESPTVKQVEELARAVEAQIPFNRLLGLHLEELSVDRARVTFEMRDELVGNFAKGALHGGVISATLDLVGGMAAMMAIADQPDADLVARFAKLGTIDLRVDYLRPGIGDHFTAMGTILRSGKKVAVTRMELRNEESALIAVGTGTYIVG